MSILVNVHIFVRLSYLGVRSCILKNRAFSDFLCNIQTRRGSRILFGKSFMVIDLMVFDVLAPHNAIKL